MTYEESETIILSVRRAYKNEEPKIQAALEFRIKETAKRNNRIEPYINEDYFCETCGSHSHKNHPDDGYCFICNTDNWKREEQEDQTSIKW